jgi:AcrR family transcriptional regulator
MPRPYRLGERATQIQATRDRIVEAAIALYSEVGISAATMRAIGDRADVAPGTLRSHFSSREDLDRTMIERLTGDLVLPELSIFDGAATLEERLRRVIRAGGVFMDRGRRLYGMWLREPMLTEPWVSKGVEYGERWDALMRTALGPLADDEDALAVLRAVIQPSFFDGLGAGNRTTEEIADLAAAVVIPWFAVRARSA